MAMSGAVSSPKAQHIPTGAGLSGAGGGDVAVCLGGLGSCLLFLVFIVFFLFCLFLGIIFYFF